LWVAIEVWRNKDGCNVVEQLADGSYKIFVHSPLIDRKANVAVVEVLANN